MSFGKSQSDGSKSRPFICLRSKSYLSYSALFTHIKKNTTASYRTFKYKASGEIVRPCSVNKGGRPRKSQTDLPADFISPLPGSYSSK